MTSDSTAPAAAPLSIFYPPALPVSAQRDEIMAAIREHQVVIVAGETGSGKTTQIPKMCLDLGRGSDGMIGHTQPRRIAARSVAQRIASELGETLGEGTVGYQVRFTREVARDARLKVMTDGILLAEISHDRLLRRYDTIIIDEAHERSLNIDVLLGYLRTILPQRPDLKVIITSATIETEKFSAFFDDAPVLEVSGRTYSVEVRYRPLVLEPEVVEEDDELDAAAGLLAVERDETEAIQDAVDELMAEGPGDILVFLPGEREIRDTADALNAHLSRGRSRRSGTQQHIEVLQLFGRLSAAEQQRIFSPKGTGATRRIVLSTNVAETSLTVPGITYVIDSGLARISRYSQRTKIQRLPIEPISQASAAQRAGRSGRTEPGIAIRLFSEEDFAARPEYTDPEVLRTTLAQVELQMISLGLDVERFPFLDAPDRRAVVDGLRLLDELGALTERDGGRGHLLTETGRLLARFPVEPRLGRMLIEADRRGCLADVLVIVAALNVQDPRERPIEDPGAAKAMHKRFEDKESDFLSILHLWTYVRDQRRSLSSGALRRTLRSEHLHYLRIREWWDLHQQLRDMARDAGLSTGRDPASDAEQDAPDPQRPWVRTYDSAAIHQSLLAGLLSHVGLYTERTKDYQGARGTRFRIWPGSGLARRNPEHVVAAEVVETSATWGRTVARIDPSWAEELGAHVVKRTYAEPHWSAKRASVVAKERVTLYGVPLVADRQVGYGRIDPELSREMFIQHALVEGEWTNRHHFFRDNRKLLAEFEEMQDRTRRRDLVVGDATLFDFYDERIPSSIVSGRHFDAWWKKERHVRPDLLTFTRDFLLTEEAEQVDAEAYPTSWTQGDLTLPLTYAFAPDSGRVAPPDQRAPGGDGTRGAEKPRDGVTVSIPLGVLNRVRPDGFDWLVPGLREEYVTALVRSLPKPIRRHLVPAPERAKAVAAILADDDPNGGEKFVEAVADELVGLPDVPDDLPLYGAEFDLTKLPDHLRMHFRVVDQQGRTLAAGDDLRALQTELKGRVERQVKDASRDLARPGLEDFPGAEIPRSHTQQVAGLTVRGYPALVARPPAGGDHRPGVDLAVLATAEEQGDQHPRGLVALLARRLDPPAGQALNALPDPAKLALAQSPYASTSALVADCMVAALDTLVADATGGDATGIRTREAYEALEERARREALPLAQEAVAQAAKVLQADRKLQKELKRATSIAILDGLTRIRDHAASLLGEGFVRRTGTERLSDLVRYLDADRVRMDKLREDHHRDARLQHQLDHAASLWESARTRLSSAQRRSDAAREIPWMLEEYRVSLFAQTVGAKYPVSDKRIARAIAAVEES